MNITALLSHSKMQVAHCDIISLMITVHDSPNGLTAATWEWLLHCSRSFKATDFGTKIRNPHPTGKA